MKACKRRSLCGVSSVLDIIGDKWSLLIIRDMMFNEKHTYSDFINSEEKIATNILADRLEVLEANGLITKEPHPESKAKFLYRLTPKSFDLLPVMLEMVVWSDKYMEVSERAQRGAKLYKMDKETLIERLRVKHFGK